MKAITRCKKCGEKKHHMAHICWCEIKDKMAKIKWGIKDGS